MTNNSTTTDSKRYAWVDYAKGIAIILVVYRHLAYGLLAKGIEMPASIIAANDMLYSFRMPLFFLLSGAFFVRSLSKRGENSFVFNKINTLLYPYLLWAIVQITLQIVFSAYTNSSRTLADYLDIFLQPRKLDQLWYLFALFNVTILYLTVNLLTKGNKYIHLLIGLVFLGFSPTIREYSALYDIMLHYIFFAVGDFGAKFFFQENVQQRLSNPQYLFFSFFVFIGLQFYYLFHQDMNMFLYLPIALYGCLFVIQLSSCLAASNKLQFFRTIGHYSLYIYLLHVSIAAILREILIRSGLTNGTILLVILIPSAISLSLLIYKCCVKFGFSFLFTGQFKVKQRSKSVSLQ
ncbi:acyltransferase [Chitinophaga silvatica]|uniref:Acyltransferase n=1 Tax=Chitinophaga silvatica TaxID=2282649 RepID=A0A3E1Y4A9_9BACT|nr:acyltransferase [Chitinophaga silvatica]RFS19560.1 acyltransferase [Chitinophaga silvatica]